ncbi:carbohydrate kinase [Gordonia amarae]|uniref:Carbohydrate kinase n=2 Tax=Gordonia amarae TaxID=36821 RepID=A0A857MH21_9ACTN|nr:carbohydrate kinase [Gordonia amarae]MCS3877912.1 fructokinase [Gordonia amarae]QHN16625.1 carbohydrate kinase [Gordonia amarae]QHN21150.1 carbohydrate kinase [Gordonia amarae]QHN38777.1 carbohydrate kinase [Gordonia amarae]GAB06450.1 putative fructokinase [Gordonia amarae NBRC 15530]
MREIVVCGEALVDVVQSAPLTPAASVAGTGALPPLQPALGGGPFNVAVTIGRLGGAVSFCSAVSEDAYGDAIIAALEAAGVGTGPVVRRPEPTTLALATIGPDGSARYSFYFDATADRQMTDPGDFAPSVAAVCFGTLSLALEPGASAYEAMMRRAHAQGRLVVLDPNIRPAAIGDHDAYRRRFASWLPDVDVLKLSDEDQRWLEAGPSGSTVAQWLDAGVGAVVTTAGEQGITVTTPGFTVQVDACEVAVADTIGAGDSVMGALVRALDLREALSARGLVALTADDWREVAAFAGRVAAVTVSRSGADPPWASELRTD